MSALQQESHAREQAIAVLNAVINSQQQALHRATVSMQQHQAMLQELEEGETAAAEAVAPPAVEAVAQPPMSDAASIAAQLVSNPAALLEALAALPQVHQHIDAKSVSARTAWHFPRPCRGFPRLSNNRTSSQFVQAQQDSLAASLTGTPGSGPPGNGNAPGAEGEADENHPEDPFGHGMLEGLALRVCTCVTKFEPTPREVACTMPWPRSLFFGRLFADDAQGPSSFRAPVYREHCRWHHPL